MKKFTIIMDNPFDQLVADAAYDLYEPGGSYPPTTKVRSDVGGKMNSVAKALGVWRRRTIALEELGDYIKALESELHERSVDVETLNRPTWMQGL